MWVCTCRLAWLPGWLVAGWWICRLRLVVVVVVVLVVVVVVRDSSFLTALAAGE